MPLLHFLIYLLAHLIRHHMQCLMRLMHFLISCLFHSPSYAMPHAPYFALSHISSHSPSYAKLHAPNAFSHISSCTPHSPSYLMPHAPYYAFLMCHLTHYFSHLFMYHLIHGYSQTELPSLQLWILKLLFHLRLMSELLGIDISTFSLANHWVSLMNLHIP